MEVMLDSHAAELRTGERFEFGRNWQHFLAHLNESRIKEAEESLKRMLELPSLQDMSFLDIGSGSGLFSLAARRLGARVHSFDYDPASVACARELKRRYYDNDSAWMIEEGSVLNAEYVRSLGKFDVVYSWGVLHHTGAMWKALDNAQIAVARGGRLFIAIYNDTGSQSVRWRSIKRTYNRLPRYLRVPFALATVAPGEAKAAFRALLRLRPQEYVHSWTRYDKSRGMSHWHDIIDWVGGYPYEVAAPEEIFDFYRARGFDLTKMKCGGVGLGCNEYVFIRHSDQ
jgi:2-polyprenyl-6-hydroxyphenyl methylase/3-demethylubiquinone-9 3-methyltransferase